MTSDYGDRIWKVLINWVLKIKRNHDELIDKYKIRLLRIRDYEQKYGINYEKV